MARRPRKKKKKDSPLWQWILVALIAFGLYQALNHFLPKEEMATKAKGPEKPSATEAQKPKVEAEVPSPIKQWDFSQASRFLPKSAYPDNLESRDLGKTQGALLAFANTQKGLDPGPQGLTNTQPGLRWVHWTGKDYSAKDLNFSALKPALAGLSPEKFEGLPRLGKTPFNEGEIKIFPTRIFLKEDDREVMAYLKVSEGNTEWAQLNHPSGKKMPAAFLLGTTAKKARQVRHRKYGGRNYLIVENGLLDETRAYEGFQWTIQAYYWNQDHFEYDREYSKKLTEAKKKS